MSIFNKKGEKTATQATQASAQTAESSAEETMRIHNLIILDESGSMQSIYHPALTGLNETLQTIRRAQNEHEGQAHFVTLVAFDSERYDQIYLNTPAAEVIDVTPEQYRPGGCTPLYDAMGRAINELRPKVAKDDVVLVTVITDGYENASCEYNGEAIKSLVEALKKEGWVFTYIGANQDVEAVATSMSIDNRLAFTADDDSTRAMFARECRSRGRFFDRLRNNMSLSELCTNDYFAEDDDAEEDKKED